jgi:hypothetical protein
LVQQRLEEVVIAPIQQRDVRVRVTQCFGGGESTESTADDDDARPRSLNRGTCSFD